MNSKKVIQTFGFTLIELSIVLVIIGLIIGGITVGRTLINASYVRAQITQIEQFQTATNVFRVKYNYLPGDIPNPDAGRFGFISRGSNAGQGDGNGILEGVDNVSTPGSNRGIDQPGENLVFWRDLTTARLIPGAFTLANFTALLSPNGLDVSGVTPNSSPSLRQYLPQAKLGDIFYINTVSSNTQNYFTLAAAFSIELGYKLLARSSITVMQAHLMDTKMDDGFPTRGNVTVHFLAYGYFGITPAQFSNPDSATTCYNNSTLAYSISFEGGANPTCALSFKMK